MTAQRPEMWGNMVPQPAEVAQLARVLRQHWMAAVERMLRNWAGAPPIVDDEADTGDC